MARGQSPRSSRRVISGGEYARNAAVRQPEMRLNEDDHLAMVGLERLAFW